MPPIVTTAEIERPAAEVFAYATDPARFSEWQHGVVDGHMEDPANGSQAPAVGAKCVTTRRIGGANRPSTSELVQIDPPRSGACVAQTALSAQLSTFRASPSPVPAPGTISVDFTGYGIGKILVPLMVRREARKEMRGNLAALKQRM